MVSAQAGGTSFTEAHLQAAVLGSANFQGADFERALLQGARFNDARSPLADFSNAFLWRATEAHCNDAQVVTPDFEAFLGFERVEKSRGRGGQMIKIKSQPDALDKFIEQSSLSVPETAASQLRSRLKERLSLQASDPQAEQSEKDWSSCATKAAEKEEYQTEAGGTSG